MTRTEDSFSKWFMQAGVISPEAWPVEGGRDVDVVSLPDGRAVWAQFYGEAPRESIYVGTEGKILTGHIHLEDDITYESYLPTVEGSVIRVVTNKADGTVTEGPSEATPEQQLALVELLDPHYYPR